MFTRKTLIQLAAIAVSSVAISASHAQWQGIAAQNAAFDAQFNARLGAMQQQNARYQQAIWQNHLKVNGPRLRSQYAQMRASGRANFTFEQFAYWDLMTAAGTNIQGAQQHQQNQFAGMAQNSARQSAAVANYTNQAIRGVAPYKDTSGRTTMLPHYLPQGQTYQYGGYTYAQDAQGAYYQQQGNAWVRMQAGR